MNVLYKKDDDDDDNDDDAADDNHEQDNVPFRVFENIQTQTRMKRTTLPKAFFGANEKTRTKAISVLYSNNM